MEKKELYEIDRFTPIELMKVHSDLQVHAKAINGLPKNDKEVFNKRGWMLPFLFAYDTLLWKRWDYWFDIIEKGTIEGSGPIPQIKWSDDPNVEEVRKMLRKCLAHPESNVEKFSEWLRWSLGIMKEGNLTISVSLNKHYYEQFDLFLVQNYPTDYLSHILSEETGKGYKGALGYYPTPFHVSILMTEMSFGNDQDYKRETVNDPCVGCGSLLLPSSNYTLRGFGQDISKIATEFAQIQMMWYAPWYAFHPEGIAGFRDSNIQLSRNRKEAEGQLVFSI